MSSAVSGWLYVRSGKGAGSANPRASENAARAAGQRPANAATVNCRGDCSLAPADAHNCCASARQHSISAAGRAIRRGRISISVLVRNSPILLGLACRSTVCSEERIRFGFSDRFPGSILCEMTQAGSWDAVRLGHRHAHLRDCSPAELQDQVQGRPHRGMGRSERGWPTKPSQPNDFSSWLLPLSMDTVTTEARRQWPTSSKHKTCSALEGVCQERWPWCAIDSDETQPRWSHGS